MSQPYYDDGTVSVSEGGTTVTGVGTTWLGVARKGDEIVINGLSTVITADASSNTGLSVKAWPGGDVVGASYYLRFLSDGVRQAERAQRYLEIAGQIAYTGIGIRALGDFADRAAYDAQREGFAFLSWDGDGDAITTPVVFVREGATAGDWSIIEYRGPKGDPGSGHTVAVTNEATPITTGAAKITFRAANALTLTAVRASLTTPSSSGPVQVDVNVDGVSILSTKITIDEGEKTSVTAAIPPVLSDTTIPDDAEITIDIDAAGTGATGLKVALIGTQ